MAPVSYSRVMFVPRSPMFARWFFLFLCLLILTVLWPAPSATRAQTDTSATSTLQAQVDQTNAQIKQLQDEIAQLQTQLNSTSAQKQTLQNAINALNLNIQKLQKSITLTQAQIKQKDVQIGRLTTTISTTSDEIALMGQEVADSLRQLNVLDRESPLVALITGGSLSSFFDASASLETVRTQLENKIEELSSLKENLQTTQTAAQQKRKEHASLQQNLNQQKTGLAISRDSQTQLLAETKNQESAYQAQIAQKKAQEAQFEQDLLNLAAQLGLTVAAGSLPPPGPLLAWPLDSVRITQYFGNTSFATQNPSIYNGHGHTGIDLAAQPGTPVKAALAGVVMGTGNTDLTCPGASFGKWVFIQHPNGLSTLYAHLSVIKVSTGDSVRQGQVIAYSDTTGYATGPHLHFGVYATSGTEIKSWPTTNPRPECKGKIYTMPVAAIQAYLNPLSYLPSVPH